MFRPFCVKQNLVWPLPLNTKFYSAFTCTTKLCSVWGFLDLGLNCGRFVVVVGGMVLTINKIQTNGC